MPEPSWGSEPVWTLAGLECLCVHCGFHTLSNLFMPCDAQFFSITLSAVCLEIHY